MNEPLSVEKDVSEFSTKPNPNQPDRCPSIDPHDTLQCGRRVHEDDQCQFGGIAWKKGTPRYMSDRERADRLEAMLDRMAGKVVALEDWNAHLTALVRAVVSYDDANQSDLPLTLLDGLHAALRDARTCPTPPAAPLSGSESYPHDACPEHGPLCSGLDCCCRDKHCVTPPAVGNADEGGES